MPTLAMPRESDVPAGTHTMRIAEAEVKKGADHEDVLTVTLCPAEGGGSHVLSIPVSHRDPHIQAAGQARLCRLCQATTGHSLIDDETELVGLTLAVTADARGSLTFHPKETRH